MCRKAFHTVVAISVAVTTLLAGCASNAPEPPPVAQTAPATGATSPVAEASTVPATPTAAQQTPLPATAVPTAVSGLPLPTATAGLPTQLITDSTLSALQPLRSIGVGRAQALAISPDNTLLVAATTAGIASFDLPSLTLLRFDSSQRPPSGVAFSPDGKQLAVELAADTDGAYVTELRSVTTGEVVASINGSMPVWSPDGTRLVLRTFSDERSHTALYGSDGKAVGEPLDGGEVVFSPNSQLLALTTAQDGGSLQTRLYNTSDNSLVATVAGGSVAWSPDSQTMATAVESTLKLWRVPSGDELGSLQDTTATDGYNVPTLAFSADGTLLHEVNQFGVRTWDLASGKLAQSSPDLLRPGSGSDVSGPVYFSPDGATLAVFSPPIEGEFFGVRLFKADSNEQIYADDASGRVSFSKDSTLAALMSVDGQVQVVTLATGTARALGLQGYSGIAFSPDGSTLAAVGSETTLWDVASGTRSSTLALDQPYGLYGTNRVQWSPDGKRLGVENSVGGEGTIFSTAISWELEGNRIGRTVWERNESATALIITAFSPANGSVASSYDSADVTVVAGGIVTSTFTLPLTVTALAFNPIGSQLAAGDARGNVLLRDLTGEGEPIKMESSEGQVSTLAYSPDGALLAAHIGAADGQGRLLLWRLGTPQPFLSIAADAEVVRLAFTSDGQMLIAGGPKGVGFYSTRDGKELGRLAIAAEDIAIGPGRRLIAVLSGERVVMYGVKP